MLLDKGLGMALKIVMVQKSSRMSNNYFIVMLGYFKKDLLNYLNTPIYNVRENWHYIFVWAKEIF